MKNIEHLKKLSYPGRGIVLGARPDGGAAIVYWIMGRSSNSRNRCFIQEGDTVKTQALDPAKLEDPSLIIYYPYRTIDSFHIISNGDQTDTIHDEIKKSRDRIQVGAASPWQDVLAAFVSALETRRYEHDQPNFTPRISAMIAPLRIAEKANSSLGYSDPTRQTLVKPEGKVGDLMGTSSRTDRGLMDSGNTGLGSAGLPLEGQSFNKGSMDQPVISWRFVFSILKKDPESLHCLREYFTYEHIAVSQGRCIHTYEGDGAPLPSFQGTPYAVPLWPLSEPAKGHDSAHALATQWWQCLHPENRISLLVRFVDAQGNTEDHCIINK